MAGTPKLIAAPAYLPAAAANIFTPNSVLKYQITHIHVTNRTAGAVTFSLFVGATGGSTAGTELVKDYSLAAAGSSTSSWDYYGTLALDGSNANHFLTGVASAGSSLVITVEGFVSAL
jgi:hypothetical protein